MKSKIENVKVLYKCNITLNLENEREIRALRNICNLAKMECYKYINNSNNYDEEFNIIKILQDAIEEH